jgi:DNA-binding transcriptional MerR regulator
LFFWISLTETVRKYFCAGEVCALTEVSYRRLDLWCRRGIIKASGRKAQGTGRRRLFTFRDVIEVRALKVLTKRGVRLGMLTQCVERLRRDLRIDQEGALASSRLVTDGTMVFRYVPERDHLESLDQYGQFAFAFGLGEEISLLTKRARRLDRHSRYTRHVVDAIDDAETVRQENGVA